MATQRLATYAPNEISVVITQESTGLTHTLSGYATDSMVDVERNSDTFEMYKGADDTATRIYKADTALKITVHLAQTSNSNDILSALYNNDATTRNGIFSVLITDNTGRSRYFAEEAYIGMVPAASYSNSMNTRQWVIHAPNSNIIMGGNSKFNQADLRAMDKLGVTVPPQWS